MAEGLVLKDIIDMVLRNKSIILSQLTKDDKSYGVPQRRLTGHSHFVEDVVLSSDCYDALSGNWDGELRLRDLATGDSTRRFVGHTKDVLSVAFSVGNRQIVSVSGDRTIKLWNSLGECKYTISEQGDGYKDWISCVRFSPNMPTIVSGSWDHTLKVWNLQNCKLRNSLAGYLNTVAVSPDCSLCASCGKDKDGVILLWDLTEGKKLYSLKAGSIIHSLCFSPNRYWLCAATENSIKIWDLESKSVVEDLQLMEMNASESESFENLTMKLNQTLSLVKELKCELYNAKKGEAQALNNASVLEKQLEITNSRIEIFGSLETELEQSKSNVKLLEQLVGDLQEGDKANKEDYRQSMLELSSAREQFKVNESQYAEIEAKLGEELKNIKAETQALHGILMYREENLRVVKKLLKLKIKEAEELNLENSLNQKEPEFTAKLKKLESDLMDKETKLQSVTSEKDSVRIEMEKMQSEKNLFIEEELAAQVTKTELEAELRRLEDHCDQWRKAVASRFSGGNNNNSNARYVERTGSLDSLLRRNVNMSLFMDETDANISPLKKKKKKNGSVLKMLGGFMKISQK